MIRRIAISIATASLCTLVPATGQAQGRLGLLEQGEYVCALPGSATGPAWQEMEAHNFAITGASSYRTDKGVGTYLLEGKRVTFTRGPMKGHRMMLLSSGLLQELGGDGKLGRLRCHRSGPLED
ncbi:elongation factor P [Qipengyuania aquimaris]|uniref:elongation factor P n=1 Tax=Qipengyuania aquimaris TaxID=255984 RepID=UPI001F3F3E40|nr:elongation factor P [Qipengyuania aquimaris]